MLHIKVLGPGCPNCHRLEALTRQALANLGVEAEIETITDMREIVSYGVLGTPGLVVNGKVVSSGRVPSLADITSYLTTALASEAAGEG